MFCLHNTSIYPITLDLRILRGKRCIWSGTEIKTIWKLQVFQKPGLSAAIWSCPISECCPTIAFSVGSDSDKVCDSLNLNLCPFTGNWEA